MGLKEMAAADAKSTKEQLNRDAATAKERLFNLKEYTALQDNEHFIKWFQEFVIEPAGKYRNLHENESDTNRNFILKGRVQAYKEQYGWMNGLTKEIKTLEDRLYKYEEEQENHSPEN